jgi:hypothetical protein
VQAANGNVVKTDFGQGGGVPSTPTWIGVHQIHQLTYGVLAIAHHQRGLATCRSDQFVAHDEQAVIMAG